MVRFCLLVYRVMLGKLRESTVMILNYNPNTRARSHRSHDIDDFSPVLPPHLRKTKESDFMLKDHGLENREADSRVGNRDGLQCLACGETYGSWENLVRHVKYSRIVEKNDGYEKQNGCLRHLDLDIDGGHPERTEVVSERPAYEGTNII